MRDVIIKELYKLEEQYDVKICYAVESGSRAWGYPSRDSDYDVRFIYVHQPDWYLSIEEKKRGVIEQKIHDSLDLSGWELRKALRLFNKSNPSIMEWLNSTNVYLESYLVVKMKDLQPKLFSPCTSIHHYLSMAISNFQKVGQSELVKLKTYLNVLRPIMAGKWAATYQSAPPQSFQKLVEHLIEHEQVKKEIQLLLKKKSDGYKTMNKLEIPTISEFIPTAISELEKNIETMDKATRPYDYTPELNKLFRNVLQEIWS
ncbi:nucleotidyltransferase domain-containing protein [Neobacillus dielmonensis]|uniref:nucleotidyltransferase domain-containing protein n=1 Tax=Neobacillus dielmonensis TaxID=1347369 RepID=UPI0005A70DA3|nr:nucleotidyltransferase domain-containing protein [Neobacillus dielmonensis]